MQGIFYGYFERVEYWLLAGCRGVLGVYYLLENTLSLLPI